MFKRNKEGDSILSISKSLNNHKGVEIINQLKSDYDKSKSIADELLGELIQEEENTEESKAKKKQKKWRNKINKIAKQEGISVEEVEKRLEQED